MWQFANPLTLLFAILSASGIEGNGEDKGPSIDPSGLEGENDDHGPNIDPDG